jgi:hypothetical protein
MKSILISLFCSLSIIGLVNGQTNVEQIFDPRTIDFGGRTLGQPGFSQISSVKKGDLIYFTAFDEVNKQSIWKTDLNQTTVLFSFPEEVHPTLRFVHQDWLVYTVGYFPFSGCAYKAIHTNTLQQIDLLQLPDCASFAFENTTYTGRYLLSVLGRKVFWQDMQALPQVVTGEMELSFDNPAVHQVLNTNEVMFRAPSNFNQQETYLLANLSTSSHFNFTARTGRAFQNLTNLLKSGSKYYFQITTELYVSKLLMECNTSFTANSFKTLNNAFGDLVYVDGNKGYIADFDGVNNTLDRYDLTTGQRTNRTVSKLTNSYFNWLVMLKVQENGYLLTTGNEYLHYYDETADTLISLMKEIDESFAIPFLALEEGVFIRYRDNNRGERLFFFPYESFNPKEILKEVVGGPYETSILSALPGNKLFAVVNDPQASYEYAVIDVLADSYRLLRDINGTSLSSLASVRSVNVLRDHLMILGVSDEEGNRAFLFDPFSKTAVPMSDLSEESDLIYILGGPENFYSFYMPDQGLFQSAVGNDSVFYFLAGQFKPSQPYLYAYTYQDRKVTRLFRMSSYDRLIMLANKLFVVRTTDLTPAGAPREILYLDGLELVPFLNLGDLDALNRNNPEQYFSYNDILYFSAGGKLFALNGHSMEVNTLVDNFANSQDYEAVLFNNFIVKDGEVYFTEVRAFPQIFIIILFGYSALEQVLWKTNGTRAGTVALKSSLYPQDYSQSPSHIFLNDGNLYMSAQLEGDLANRLYRWQNNDWIPTPVLWDGVLRDSFPYFYFPQAFQNDFMPKNSQRVLASVDDISFFEVPIVENVDETHNTFSQMYSFKSGGIPEVTSRLFSPTYVETLSSYIQKQSQVQLGDYWYYSIISGDMNINASIPEIFEYSLIDGELEQILPSTSAALYTSLPLFTDPLLGAGYFTLGSDFSGGKTLWRFKICQALVDDVSILQISDTICPSTFVEADVTGISNFNLIFVKLNGIRQVARPEKDPITGRLRIRVEAEAGDYELSYWITNGCEEQLVETYPVFVRGTQPELSIAVEETDIPGAVQYSSVGGPFDSYSWTVIGSTNFTGQGTDVLTVNWGSTSLGSVELVVTDEACPSAPVAVIYRVVSSSEASELQQALLVPNPAKEYVSILLPYNSLSLSYAIFDLSGQLHQSGFIQDQQQKISVSGLPSGMYIIQLQDSSKTAALKLIVAR